MFDLHVQLELQETAVARCDLQRAVGEQESDKARLKEGQSNSESEQRCQRHRSRKAGSLIRLCRVAYRCHALDSDLQAEKQGQHGCGCHEICVTAKKKSRVVVKEKRAGRARPAKRKVTSLDEFGDKEQTSKGQKVKVISFVGAI